MTSLVNLQNSDGMFEIPNDDLTWHESVFNIYTGTYEKVKMNCPEGTAFNLWITALAMKIMELKMPEKKDLWELVAQKSKKYLLGQFVKKVEEYNKLQESAEQYIMNA